MTPNLRETTPAVNSQEQMAAIIIFDLQREKIKTHKDEITFPKMFNLTCWDSTIYPPLIETIGSSHHRLKLYNHCIRL